LKPQPKSVLALAASCALVCAAIVLVCLLTIEDRTTPMAAGIGALGSRRLRTRTTPSIR
jgi:hypothetical protein